jgi:hypothetical protein
MKTKKNTAKKFTTSSHKSKKKISKAIDVVALTSKHYALLNGLYIGCLLFAV